jgi:hypothetical protein
LYPAGSLTNQIFIQEEIKNKLNLGNAYYLTVQNVLSFCIVSKNVKTKMYKTVIFLLFCVGVEISPFTLREEQTYIEGV